MGEPILTEEELAWWDKAFAGLVVGKSGFFLDIKLKGPRLIAALRATQEENAQLRDALGDIERRLCPCPEHEQRR